MCSELETEAASSADGVPHFKTWSVRSEVLSAPGWSADDVPHSSPESLSPSISGVAGGVANLYVSNLYVRKKVG